MINRFLIIFILILALPLSKLSANECGIAFDNLNSPLCTNAKYIFWTGAVLTGGLYYMERKKIGGIEQAVLRKDHLKSFSKLGEYIGWGYLNGLYIIGTLASGWSGGGKTSFKYSELMMEATAYTMLVTVLLKESVSETRPDGSATKDSFPSGHSSSAFAFASVVGINHGPLWGILAHGVAAFIAYSRVEDKRHHPHDVVAGATIGASYAWGIYLNHKKYRKPYWFALMPSNDLSGLKLAFQGRF